MCAICGSDLHLLDGYQPTMKSGDILGHENMGEVIELGSEVTQTGSYQAHGRIVLREIDAEVHRLGEASLPASLVDVFERACRDACREELNKGIKRRLAA